MPALTQAANSLPSTLAGSTRPSNDTAAVTDADNGYSDNLTSGSDRGSMRPVSETSCSPQEGAATDTFTANTSTSPDSHSDRSPSFYGATSHPHVISPGDENHWPDVGEDDEVGISLDPTSPHLRDKLLQTFFKYQTLWVDVVKRETFVAGQAAGRPSLWYSKLLEYSMLACASRLSTSRSVRALGPRLFGLAIEEVLPAMSEPTPANLQGFLLMSEYEVTQGNDRRGWMFCGMPALLARRFESHFGAMLTVEQV